MPLRHDFATAICPFILVLQLGCAKPTQDEATETKEVSGEIRLAKRVEARESMFPLANNRGAAIAVLLFQLLGKLG